MPETEPTLPDFKFRDKKNRVWDVSLTYAEARRVDASDFSEVTKHVLGDRKFSFAAGPTSGDKEEADAFLTAIMTDSIRTAIIWAIVQPQVKDAMGIDPVTSYAEAEAEFLSGFDGRTKKESEEVFWLAVADFFQDKRTLLETMRNQMLRATETVNRKFREKAETMDAMIEKMLDEEFDKADQLLTSGGK